MPCVISLINKLYILFLCPVYMRLCMYVYVCQSYLRRRLFFEARAPFLFFARHACACAACKRCLAARLDRGSLPSRQSDRHGQDLKMLYRAGVLILI